MRKPQAYLLSPTGKPKYSDDPKSGSFSDRSLSKHIKSDAHKAASKQGLDYFLERGFDRVQKAHDEKARAFQRHVLWLASEEMAIQKIANFAKFEQADGRDVPNNVKLAWLIVEAAAEIIQRRHMGQMNKSRFHAMGWDEGHDAARRSLCAVTLGTDTYHLPKATSDQFLHFLPVLDWYNLDTEGFLQKLEETPGMEWLKILWVLADGASLNGSVVRRIQELYNPWVQYIWCENHKGKLCFEDCVKNDPNLWVLIQKMDALYHHFHFSMKARSRLKDALDFDHVGKWLPDRTGNTTRWHGAYTATGGLIQEPKPLLPKILKVLCDEVCEKWNREPSETVCDLLGYWSDYRSITRCVILHKLAAHYNRFHNAMELAEADFTTETRELKVLKTAVTDIADENPAIKQRTTQLIQECSVVGSGERPINQILQRIDSDTRFGEEESKWIDDIVKSTEKEFVRKFRRSFAVRFPGLKTTPKAAFSVLDPAELPPGLSKMSDDEAKKFLKTYGVDRLLILGDFYGKSHVLKGGTKLKGLIDKRKLLSQWKAFLPWMVELKLAGSIQSFADLLTRTYQKARGMDGKGGSPFWGGTVSEVIKLMRIVEPRRPGSAANERVFSATGRTVTSLRTTMTDYHTQCTVLIGFETKRMYGNQPQKLVPSMLDDKAFQDLLAEKKAEANLDRREREALAPKAKRQKLVHSKDPNFDYDDEEKQGAPSKGS